jgi:preprotein translocase SecE subunit
MALIAQAYKQDQGRLVRLAAFWILVGWSVYAATALDSVLTDKFEFFARDLIVGTDASGRADPWELPVLGWRVNWALAAGLVVLAAGVWTAWTVNHTPRYADLLIETESELKKVTWPSGKDVVDTSLVVILLVLVLMGYLAGSDWFLARVMKALIFGAGS